MGDMGATCFKTLSETERDIAKPDWDKERLGMLCTISDTFTEWKKVILKLCDDTKKCTFDVKEGVIKFNARAQRIAAKAKGVK